MSPSGGEDKIFKAIKAWKNVNWYQAETRIFSLQKRIFAASENFDHLKSTRQPTSKARSKLLSLQRMLVTHPYAKLIAVKHVSEQTRENKTTDLNKIANVAHTELFDLAKKLHLAEPNKSIRKVENANRQSPKTVRSRISVLRNQAQQCLIKMALEPTWEAKFKLHEPNVYGFRPNKGSHDATHALEHALGDSQKYILHVDLTGFFDNVDHEQLLSKIDCNGNIKEVIQKWLKLDQVKGFPNGFPENVEKAHRRTFHSNSLSPLLANIALYGLEKAVHDNYANTLALKYGQVGETTTANSVAITEKYTQLTVIRYANDFVALHPSEEMVKFTEKFVREWLQKNIGIELADTQTSIVNSANGFNFLGFTATSVCKSENKVATKWKTRIRVSKKAKDRLITQVRQVLSNKSWSQEQIITRLNPIVIRWCSYYCAHECIDDFKQVEGTIFQMLIHWVLRRKSKNLNGNRLKAKYFKSTSVTFQGTVHSGNYIFGCEIKEQGQEEGKKTFIFFPYPSWVKSK